MKLEKFTQKCKTGLSQGLLVGFLGLFIFLSANQASAQNCPLVCNNDVQISLDDDCQVTVTPDMILEGPGPNSCNYRVVIKDLNGFVIPGSPVIGSAYVGKTLQVGVYNGPSDDDNNCWGYVHLEDKLKPSIVCPDTAYYECYNAPVNYLLPIGQDNCGGVVTVVQLSDETVNLDCDSDYSAKRTIIYQATDESGNISDLCYRIIYYVRVNLVDIVWPRNYDGIDTIVLPCSNTPYWDRNGNYYPDPDETGAPTSPNGALVFPNNILCELNVVYSDDVLEICENSFKVLRHWTVMDWCTGDVEQRFQIIKIMDQDDPIVTAHPDVFEAFTHPYTCTAEFLVPPPISIFDCSSTSYIVEYKTAFIGGIYSSNGVTGNDVIGYTLHGLVPNPNTPPGTEDVWIRYTVTDACGNKTQAYTEVEIIDNVPPVAVCDQFTVVSLTNTGYAYVEAESFDDGSHDNCSPVSFRVRRMTGGCGSNGFGPYVIFCCADIGNDDLRVVLEVSDANGNTNTCMVNVTLQDKFPPVITCPGEIWVDCTADYEDLSLTGNATAVDNCGSPVITHNDAGSLGNCHTGNIYRTFTATDGDGRTHSCTQVIHVVNNNPFYGDIDWPNSTELDGCMEVDTDPSNPALGEPEYDDDACSLIAHTYEDQVFTFVDDACFKILRHWTVIDWCVYEESNGTDGIWGPHTQIIKVFDDIAPVLGDCAYKEICTYEVSTTQCGGNVTELVQTAIDDCSGADDELTWAYIVEEDLDGNGVYEFDRNGTGRSANGYYLNGKYRVKWIVEDNCGNFKECLQYFLVKDCKNPTPYCLGEVTTVVMNNTGTIETWASDFDLGSYDNCPGDLRFSFYGTHVNNRKLFTCDDIGLNTVQMWVWDAAGNKDYCEVVINIQDHSGACPDPSGVTIAGLIRNENDIPLEGAPVTISEGAEHAPVMHTTDEEGIFTFAGMTENGNFNLSVGSDDDYINGVTTLDILLIQRHILKLKDLSSAYKIIAADVDKNNKITGNDIIELRRLILGKVSKFENNTSWRFVDGKQEFDDILDPFEFDEEIDLASVITNNKTNNFVAVKIGDVNNDVEMNLNSDTQSDNRLAKTMDFKTKDVDFKAGEMVTMNLNLAQLKSITGFQFTLDYNATMLTFDHVTSSMINMDDKNVGTSLLGRGKVNVSWSNINAQSINDEVLFTVVFKANTSGQLSDAVSINSTLTNAEVYDNNLETYNLELKYINNEVSNSDYVFELMQNEPNPFVGETTVRFVLPQASTASLKVFDVTGKELIRIEGEFSKGENVFKLGKDQLNASGILYYQLEADQYTATRKMVLMNR